PAGRAEPRAAGAGFRPRQGGGAGPRRARVQPVGRRPRGVRMVPVPARRGRRGPGHARSLPFRWIPRPQLGLTRRGARGTAHRVRSMTLLIIYVLLALGVSFL